MSVVVYGEQKWYYYLNNEEHKSLLKSMKEEDIENKDVLFVCREISNGEKIVKTYSYFPTVGKFNLLLTKLPSVRDFNFYEIIFGKNQQKPYFDIDITPEKVDEPLEIFCQSLLENLVLSIKTTILTDYIETKFDLTKDILLFSSSSEIKKSFHIIVKKFAVKNNVMNKEFFYKVIEKLPEKFRPFIDDKVYSSTQQFRLYLSQKISSNRPKVLMTNWSFFGTPVEYKYYIEDKPALQFARVYEVLYDSLISQTSKCVPLTVKTMAVRVHHVLTSQVDDPDIKITENLFEQIKAQVANEKIYKLLNIYNIVGFKDKLITLIRKQPSMCPICQRIHEHENAFLFLNTRNQVFFRCFRDDLNTSIMICSL